MPFDFKSIDLSGLKGGAKTLASHVGGGLTLGVAGAATAAVGVGAHKAYEALTQRRDFRRMMSNPFNTDLKEFHDRDPASFNAAFTGLRDANYELSSNPMTAGAYMRRMLTLSPEAAGGILVEARNNQLENGAPVRDAFQRAGLMGAQTAFQEHLRDQGELSREARMPGLEKKKLQETLDERKEFERSKMMDTYADRLQMEHDKAEHMRRMDMGFIPVAGPNQAGMPGAPVPAGKRELGKLEQLGRNQAEFLQQKKLHRHQLHPYAPRP